MDIALWEMRAGKSEFIFGMTVKRHPVSEYNSQLILFKCVRYISFIIKHVHIGWRWIYGGIKYSYVSSSVRNYCLTLYNQLYVNRYKQWECNKPCPGFHEFVS